MWLLGVDVKRNSQERTLALYSPSECNLPCLKPLPWSNRSAQGLLRERLPKTFENDRQRRKTPGHPPRKPDPNPLTAFVVHSSQSKNRRRWTEKTCRPKPKFCR